MEAGHSVANVTVDFNKSEEYRIEPITNEFEPIILNSIECAGLKLRFLTPLTLYPQKDESGEYLIVEDDDYELFAYAENRKELETELNSVFAVMWKIYVIEENKKLTLEAAKLRQNLLDNLVEEGGNSAIV